MALILIVEDESIIRSALTRLLQHNGYAVAEADSVDRALEVAEQSKPDLIISDLRLPGRPGTDLIQATETPVLIMTSYASLRSAVDSMKLGAVDYIAKPFDHDEMLASIKSILDRRPAKPSPPKLEAENSSARTDINDLMFGECTEMLKLFDLIGKVSPTDTTVLIQGESGTGKELAARALHMLSRRREGALICVNCAAIPETLIESELFGHEKGAFTGAVGARSGLIEAADGGTLFLDEIGELPLEAQARLLRVLQEGEIRRVGSTQSKRVDVRLIAATHRNLKAMTKVGEFREDLFYRLNVMQLRIPPLRDREDDVIGLAKMLLTKMGERMDKPNLKFDKDALTLIRRYQWPGNVREMENAVERAVILSDSDHIGKDLLAIDLEGELDIPEGMLSMDNPANSKGADKGTDLSLEDYFQHFVLENQDTMSETELARKLGISRKSLWERRQRLGIPRTKKSAK
ncbi:response regulator [Hahella sp. KA22]|uniref:sigma-54-dependent transcriptional regulator n=1 Tax=Hahella sp. KA22 TaxID=1628392 RepID=UPI000FDDF269|nr:sigma-54 dependent transcriptional regulator [Hahella sp. KA22]AZZ94655.1 sigma-54-dependent Fis family transcriptional regulator [Hahella sp. KA22]QAY58028.1 response regulator [Hahella sp. KA22]